jgi:hypothetical protein
MSEKQEAKSLNINLDSKSIEILKGVDAIHRDSLINVGLALVEKTGYYKTLSGKNNTDILEDVVSLDAASLDGESSVTSTSKTTETKDEIPKSPATTWDSF